MDKIRIKGWIGTGLFLIVSLVILTSSASALTFQPNKIIDTGIVNSIGNPDFVFDANNNKFHVVWQQHMIPGENQGIETIVKYATVLTNDSTSVKQTKTISGGQYSWKTNAVLFDNDKVYDCETHFYDYANPIIALDANNAPYIFYTAHHMAKDFDKDKFGYVTNNIVKATDLSLAAPTITSVYPGNDLSDTQFMALEAPYFNAEDDDDLIKGFSFGYYTHSLKLVSEPNSPVNILFYASDWHTDSQPPTSLYSLTSDNNGIFSSNLNSDNNGIDLHFAQYLNADNTIQYAQISTSKYRNALYLNNVKICEDISIYSPKIAIDPSDNTAHITYLQGQNLLGTGPILKYIKVDITNNKVLYSPANITSSNVLTYDIIYNKSLNKMFVLYIKQDGNLYYRTKTPSSDIWGEPNEITVTGIDFGYDANLTLKNDKTDNIFCVFTGGKLGETKKVGITWMDAAPTKPANIKINNKAIQTGTTYLTQNTVALSWDPCIDSISKQVTYSIYDNEKLLTDKLTPTTQSFNISETGLHKIKIRAYDTNNNYSESKFDVYRTDTPIEFSGFPIGENAKIGNKIQFTGYVTSIYAGISTEGFSVNIKRNNGDIVDKKTVIPVILSAQSATFSVSFNDLDISANETLKINITAKNNQGNIGTHTINVIGENTPPAFTEIKIDGIVTDPASCTYVGIVNPSITWTATDIASGLDKVEVSHKKNEPGSNWISDATITKDNYCDLSHLSEGLYSIKLIAYDKIGNQKSEIRTFLVDKTDPTIINFSSPVNKQAYKGSSIPAGASCELTDQAVLYNFIESYSVKLSRDPVSKGTPDDVLFDKTETLASNYTQAYAIDNTPYNRVIAYPLVNLTDGKYNLEISAKDATGNESKPGKREFYIDNAGPIITISKTSLSPDYAPEYKISISDNYSNLKKATVELRDLSNNLITSENMLFNQEIDSFSESNYKLNYLVPGYYKLWIYADDILGNHSVQTLGITIALPPPTNNPTITNLQISSKKQGDITIGNPSFTWKASAPNGGVSKTEVKVYNYTAATIYSKYLEPATANTIALPDGTIPKENYSELYKNSYSVNIKVTDASGISTSKMLGFKVDTTAPVILANKLENWPTGEGFAYELPSGIIDKFVLDIYSYDQLAGINIVALDIKKGAGWGLDTGKSIISPDFKYDENTSPISGDKIGHTRKVTSSFEKGKNYTYTITSSDDVGNVSTYESSFIFDNSDPVLTITSHTPGVNEMNYSKTTGITITGKAIDDNLASLTVNGNPVKYEQDGSFSYPFNLVEGVNTIPVIATDTTGKTDTEIIKITVDTTKPVITSVSVGGNLIASGSTLATPIADSTPEIKVEINELANSLVTIEVYQGEALIASNSPDYDTSTWTPAALANGTYTVKVKAMDKAGWESEQYSGTFTVNTIPKPTNLTISKTNNLVSLSWNKVAGYTQYKIYVSDTNNWNPGFYAKLDLPQGEPALANPGDTKITILLPLIDNQDQYKKFYRVVTCDIDANMESPMTVQIAGVYHYYLGIDKDGNDTTIIDSFPTLETSMSVSGITLQELAKDIIDNAPYNLTAGLFVTIENKTTSKSMLAESSLVDQKLTWEYGNGYDKLINPGNKVGISVPNPTHWYLVGEAK